MKISSPPGKNTILGLQGGLTNLGLSYSASGGVGTLSLTTADGSTPSSSLPVSINFQSGSGSITTIKLTSALTLDIASGATLGSDGSNLRVWVVIFNDGGTLRLGVKNCRSATTIYPLSESESVSSTAMSSSSDSAGVFYTDSAVTSKYYRVIGFFEIDSLTPGTWVSSSRISLYSPGMHLPGDVIQSLRVTEKAYTTTTQVTPIDDTIPQNTESTVFFSQAITPSAKANVLSLSTYCWASNTITAVAIIYCFFQDSTADALFAGDVTILAASYRQLINTDYRLVSGTTSSTTFKMGLGASGASTTSINGLAGVGRYYGGSSESWFKVEEIMA